MNNSECRHQKTRFENLYFYERDYQVIGYQIGQKINHKEEYRDCGIRIVVPEKPSIEVTIANTKYDLSKLTNIAFAIENARPILDLDEDWNNNNAKRIEETTWNNAVIFLIEYSKYILNEFGCIIKSPEINPSSNGSIDLVWRTKNARLLINFKPTNNQVMCSYYGDLFNDLQPIKGVIADRTIQKHLAFWMKNLI
jgi:hypothetical protein